MNKPYTDSMSPATPAARTNGHAQASKTVSGRVDKIIAWLMAHQREIEQMEKGQVTFHCAGETNVVAEVVKKFAI